MISLCAVSFVVRQEVTAAALAILKVEMRRECEKLARRMRAIAFAKLSSL
jgi:hypothetical protein